MIARNSMTGTKQKIDKAMVDAIRKSEELKISHFLTKLRFLAKS